MVPLRRQADRLSRQQRHADTDYADSITSRDASGTGYFRGGTATGTSHADFDQAYDPYTSYSQGAAGGGGYTVQAGDTVSSIAQAVWGDASLWYELAQANGLSTDTGLVEGQMLTIPPGVSRSGNTAATLRPYDPSDAIGNLSGINPVPQPKNHGCGAFGAILLVVIAVAVTIATAGAAVAALGPAGTSLGTGIATVLGTSAGLAGGVVGAVGIGGAIAIGAGAAALGSIVSQGVGVATGLQDRFSWKGVALAALSGGVGGGLGASGLGKVGGSAFAGSVTRGALGNLATQGIALATGLQGKFDWTGVAVGAAVGAGIGAVNLGGTGGRLVAGLAGALAGGATRSLLTGTDFGDNILAALPDVIGSTIGELVAGGIAGDPYHTGGIRAQQGAVQFAQNGDPDVQSDSDIIVVGRRLLDEGEGLLERLWNGATSFVEDLFSGPPRSVAQRDDLTSRITMSIDRASSTAAEVANGFGHGVYDVGAGALQGLYHVFTTNPMTTVREMMYGAAGTIDGALAAEDIPARVQMARVASAIGNASAYDIGYGIGQVGGNVGLFLAPELAGASRLKFAGGAGNAGIEAAGRWGAAAHPLTGASVSDVVGMAASAGLQTQRDSLVLWSGLGADGALRAQGFAREFGGTTLEMTPGGRWLESMDLYGSASPFTSVEADMIWGNTSAQMVGQASGQVRSVLGQVRPGSVYKTYELPALRDNRAILGLDPLQVRPMMKAGGY